MEYIFALDNANLTLRVVELLHGNSTLPINAVTVLHHREGWILRVQFKWLPHPQHAGDLLAFMEELGYSYQPSRVIAGVFQGLDAGQSPMDMIKKYQVSVVAHGQPTQVEIEAFRQQFIQGLGYCPPSLA